MCGAMRSCAAQMAFQSGAVLLDVSAVGVALISVRFLDASLSHNYGIVGCVMPAPESSFEPSTLARSTRADQALLFLAAFLRSLFFGMVNALGRDRGPAYALEQAILPQTTTPERRTFLLAWYALTLDGGLALGSLLAGAPHLLRTHWLWASQPAYRAAWILAACLSLLSAILSASLSSRMELPGSDRAGSFSLLPKVKPESRRRITRLALLTGMDSFGGGFLTTALVSFWFFRRFGIGEQYLGPLFFGARVANAASHLVEAWLAGLLGLLNSIVLTHLPSSLFLMAVPFAPNFAWATVLFLCREALVEMDVPTRQSYIVAVVEPGERAVATGMSVLTRNVAYATAPVGAGLAMSGLSFASPLFFGAGIKIAYDILLYVSFRRIKPPEEGENPQ